MKYPHYSASKIQNVWLAIRGYHVALAAIFVISMWLRAAFPIFAIGNAMHDDFLFIKLAGYIWQGDWLGVYDNLTHAKGVAYPVFIFVNHVTGLPLKFSEHLLYLSAALFFSSMLGRIYATQWATLFTFALLAFIPTAWSPDVGGRVIREGIYVSLSLFLLGLAIRCFVVQRTDSVAEELREKWPWLLMLGLVAGIYWLTREEGIWLLPALAIIIAHWAWSRRPMLRHWKLSALYLALPLIPMLFVIGTVNSLNYVKYDVFRNNDFRSADFQAAYGALSRIKHDQWQRYVLFPRDARERAYRFSSAARELRPFFEGWLGEAWRKTGCEQSNIKPCTEILSGWFMWALRDVTAAAGHYQSAQEARTFYQRLATEIDIACKQNPGECLPYRQTMVPPWRVHYLVDTLRASRDVFGTLISLGGAPVSVGASIGSEQQLATFSLATNGTLAPARQSSTGTDPVSPIDGFRFKMARGLAVTESKISEIGVPFTMITCLFWLSLAMYRRRLDPSLVIALALTAAVAVRVLLLGFLEATSIPSNNMLYLSPVAPMALALIPTVLFGIAALARTLYGEIATSTK